METFYRSCTGTLLEEKRKEKRREEKRIYAGKLPLPLSNFHAGRD
jgi:hypothetical protein